MSEKINQPISPEEQKRLQDIEDLKELEAYLETHPEPAAEELKSIEAELEIEKFNELIATFEANHSLDALHAFSDITPENVDSINAIREPARLDLIPIYDQLKLIEERADVTNEILEGLKADRRRLSQAVGMINKKKVHHDR
jgi:hypothetical protein